MKKITLIGLLSIALILPTLPLLAQSGPDQTATNRFIQRLDQNQDGLVSADEFRGPAERFERLDRNSDGSIDAAEAPEGRSCRRYGKHPDRAQYDLDGDGRISQEEFISMAQQRFERLDRNGDGHIDAAEWAGSKRGGKLNR
jgi:Ca2+-binding EF-hand superfamily protein